MIQDSLERKASLCFQDYIREQLGAHNELLLEVSSDCMRPLIFPSDKVVVKSCEIQNLNPGDIILFQDNTQLYVHRLIAKERKEGKFILTPKADRACMRDRPFFAEQFLGKVVRIKKKFYDLNLERYPGKIINRLTFFLSKFHKRGFFPFR